MFCKPFQLPENSLNSILLLIIWVKVEKEAAFGTHSVVFLIKLRYLKLP